MTNKLQKSILSRILPDRTKRLVLISTLVGCLKEKEEVDERYLQLLNTRLALSDDVSAMKLPIKFNTAIWPPGTVSHDFKSIKDEDQDEEVRSFAQRLLRLAPEYLRYNNESAIIDDIASLLRFEVSIGCKIAS